MSGHMTQKLEVTSRHRVALRFSKNHYSHLGMQLMTSMQEFVAHAARQKQNSALRKDHLRLLLRNE
jgi:hemoglobin-like flavoprotein